MKTTKKKLKHLIKEAIIKYNANDDAVMALNAAGVFSRENLEKQFQNFYDEGLQYQKTIIANPDGSFDQLIDDLGQATAAANLYRYIESLLTAKYGPGAAIIFNLSDFSERNEKEILDFPSLEKAIKRASGYDIEGILYLDNVRDFPDTEGLSSKTPREISKNFNDLQASPGGNEEKANVGFSSFSFYDDDDVTVPRHEYEPTVPKARQYDPTGVVARK